MKGIIILEDSKLEDVKYKLDKFLNIEVVRIVIRKEVEYIKGNGLKVVVMDFGVKRNILRLFIVCGCDIIIFLVIIFLEDVLSINFDLIFLLNGFGDLEDLEDVIENIKVFIGKKFIVGICLGY